ncbi:G-protein coupled receptor GRL101 [Biomphalaria glabrata]|nr:G-protein coupled receptor GRL101 [Biomphalaria glabrata]
MHIEDIEDITSLAEFYSTICADTNCPSQDLSFTSKNALHSFYHINLEPQEISSEEARQYCSQIPNNYVLSLETIEEIEFIFQYLHDTSFLTISSELHLHIGLRFVCWFFLNWSSGFPFVLHHFAKTEFKGCSLITGDKWYPEYCFVLTPEKYDQHYELFVISKPNQTIYIKEIDCRDKMRNSVVMCECHTHALQNQLIDNVFYDNNADFLISYQSLADLKYLFTSGSLKTFKKLGISAFKKTQCKDINDFDFLQASSACQILLNNTSTYVDTLLQRPIPIYFKFDSYVVHEKDKSLTKCLYYKHCKTDTSKKGKKKKKAPPIYCVLQRQVEKCDSQSTTCNNSLSLSVEDVQCKNNIEPPYQCIFDRYEHSNHNLKNCETFNCPKNFFKCPQSYCIKLENLADGIKDCLFGEDEVILKQQFCYGNVIGTMQEMCINLDDYILFSEHYICSEKCPHRFKCFSTL